MQKHYVRKYELTAVLFVCAVVLISSIVATVYGVYPFEEFRPELEWSGFDTGGYYERQGHHSTRY